MQTRIAGLVLMLISATAAGAAADPPERVARISFLTGTTSVRSATAVDWTQAVVNYPLTIGDHVWTDRAGRLELQAGATAVDLDAMTAASVLNLDHQILQLRIAQGLAIARVRELAPDESLEIDTPNGAVTVLRAGTYRIEVSPGGDTTTITVRDGEADITTGAAPFPVHVRESVAITGLETPAHEMVGTVPLDEFEDWATFRDRRIDGTTARYVPRAVVGYDDLDAYGTWRVVPEYGPVWTPQVRAGWAPYHVGHWAWVEPWGWTWIDDAPWGFAPFHYGRWAYLDARWVWVPGALVARPVYAPALVAFVGGPTWRVANVGEPVGWFPLGPREVFVPAYTVTPAYVVAINRPHAVVGNVAINVTSITYVNRAVPGAVTVVSREVFTQARPVAAAAVVVAPQALSAAVVVGHAAPHEFMPVRVARSATVAPPAAVVSRTVIVRAPPAAPGAAVRMTVSVPTRSTALAQAPAAPVRMPPPAAAPRGVPGPAAAEMAARHAQEQRDIEARHSAERAELQARQRDEAARAATAQARADARARQTREQAALDARQKNEHAEMRARQESERRNQDR
jgi:hypothetical protein